LSKICLEKLPFLYGLIRSPQVQTKKDTKNAVDKIKAGAKAVGNKIKDPDRDLGTEYEKEKIKEKIE